MEPRARQMTFVGVRRDLGTELFERRAVADGSVADADGAACEDEALRRLERRR